MKKDWTWYTGVLEYYTCSSILYILHVRAILGKKAAQLPTRASGGAKNTKLDLLLGYCFFLRRTLNIRFLVCVPSCGTLNQIVVRKVQIWPLIYSYELISVYPKAD